MHIHPISVYNTHTHTHICTDHVCVQVYTCIYTHHAQAADMHTPLRTACAQGFPCAWKMTIASAGPQIRKNTRRGTCDLNCTHAYAHAHACMHATCTRALHPKARTSILNPSANASTHDAHAPCVRTHMTHTHACLPAHICTHAYRMDTRAPRRSVSGWPSLLKGLRHSRHLWPRSACNTNLIVWVPV